MEIIIKSWQGRARLVYVWWVYPISFTLLTLALAFVLMFTLPAQFALVNSVVLAILLVCFFIWHPVSVWRCAFNCKWRGWGYIARVLIIVNFLYFCIEIAPVAAKSFGFFV